MKGLFERPGIGRDPGRIPVHHGGEIPAGMSARMCVWVREGDRKSWPSSWGSTWRKKNSFVRRDFLPVRASLTPLRLSCSQQWLVGLLITAPTPLLSELPQRGRHRRAVSRGGVDGNGGAAPNPPPSKHTSNVTALRCQDAPSGDAALCAFRAHHLSGRALDANPALIPALTACAQLPSAAAEAEQIHALLVKSGIPLSVSNVYASTSLVHVYARLGRLGDAWKVFDGMPERTVVSWNVLLDALVRAGDLDAAWEVFVEMPEWNVVSWNTVMAGFARHGWAQEAVELFVEMTTVYGLAPDEATMVSFVTAVRDIGLLGLGRSTHGYVIRQEFSLDGALGVTLINMYTRCGSMGAAYRCFSSVTSKYVEHWTSVIGCFAVHGHPEMALRLFAEMRQLGIEPNGVTFVAILNSCSHGGLVDEGFKYFNLMRSMGIRPTIKHYGCLVDLLCRAGFLEEAFKLASSLPEDPGFVIWSSLLAACLSHGNVEMAEVAAQKLAYVEPSHGSSYVLLSNMYAHAGQWEDLKRTRRRMEEHGVMKKPGLSWIEAILFLLWGLCCCKIGWDSVMRMSADLWDLFLYEAFLYYNPLLVALMIWLWGVNFLVLCAIISELRKSV